MTRYRGGLITMRILQNINDVVIIRIQKLLFVFKQLKTVLFESDGKLFLPSVLS